MLSRSWGRLFHARGATQANMSKEMRRTQWLEQSECRVLSISPDVCWTVVGEWVCCRPLTLLFCIMDLHQTNLCIWLGSACVYGGLLKIPWVEVKLILNILPRGVCGTGGAHFLQRAGQVWQGVQWPVATSRLAGWGGAERHHGGWPAP